MARAVIGLPGAVARYAVAKPGLELDATGGRSVGLLA
jgi:hypothetical protein